MGQINEETILFFEILAELKPMRRYTLVILSIICIGVFVYLVYVSIITRNHSVPPVNPIPSKIQPHVIFDDSFPQKRNR